MDRGIKNRTLPRLRQEEAPEPEPWCPQELQNSWKRGNRWRPLPSNHSDSHKVDLYRLQLRWKAFCHRLRRLQERKVLIKTLTFDNKSLGESFIRYLMRDSELRETRQTINAKSSIRVYTRKLGGLYKTDTGNRGTDLLEIIFANTADASSHENGGCGENPKSSLLWADFLSTTSTFSGSEILHISTSGSTNSTIPLFAIVACFLVAESMSWSMLNL
ncbi:hypothetical protein VB005_03349 [Metarhizium brunneum]